MAGKMQTRTVGNRMLYIIGFNVVTPAEWQEERERRGLSR